MTETVADLFGRWRGAVWWFPDQETAAAAAPGFGRETLVIAAPEFLGEPWLVRIEPDDEHHEDDGQDLAASTAEILDHTPAALRPWLERVMRSLVALAQHDLMEVIDGGEPWEYVQSETQTIATSVAELASLARRHPGMDARDFDYQDVADVEGMRAQFDEFATAQFGRKLTHPERLDCAALGLTLALYRNSPLEDHHADGRTRLHDDEMLRGNVSTYRALRAILDAGPDWSAVRDCLLDKRRRMPDGRVFSQWIGRRYPAYAEHVEGAVSGLIERAQTLGSDSDMIFYEGKGLLACRSWFGHPQWPGLVSSFMETVDRGEFHDRPLGPLPEGWTPDRLETTLRSDPSVLSREAADWCVGAGLGFHGAHA